jgi:hypothetical protein
MEEARIVHLTRRCPPTFTSPVPFPDDSCAVSVNGNPHSGDVDRQEGPAVFPGERAR